MITSKKSANIVKTLMVLLMTGVLLISIPQSEATLKPPILPTKFNGFVLINNESAPAGTPISAFVNDVFCKTVYTFDYENESAYVIEVDCGENGDLISFKTDNVSANQTALYKSGIQLNYFNLTFEVENHPPIIISDPVTVAVVDHLYEYDVDAIDQDNDTLEYTLIVYPGGMNISNETGQITWIPSHGQLGLHNATAEVSDGHLTDNQTFTITVFEEKYYITTLADGSKEKNLTFNESGDIVEYLSMPKNATVLSAIMNLTGLGLETGSQENIIFSDDFDDGDISDWTVTTEEGGIFEPSTEKFVSSPYSVHMKALIRYQRAMGVSPTYPYDLNLSEDYNATFNFLVPHSTNHWYEIFNNNQTYLILQSGTTLGWYDGSSPHSIMLLNQSQWYPFKIVVHQSSNNYDVYVDSQKVATCSMWIHGSYNNCFRIGERSDDSQYFDYGEAYWDDFVITQGESTSTSYPTNPSLDVGNDSDIQWSYSGVFNVTETVPDFATELNEFIANCTPDGDNCTVPLVFHSDSAGIINISDIMIIYAFPNHPPDKPLTLSGPTEGETWVLYNYSTSTTDPNGDAIYYKWDWDDGNMSEWLGPYPSGETCNVSYYWTTNNTYNIRVKAKDTNELESEWSDPLPVFIEEGFYINLFKFPMYEAEYPYHEMCGPAVAQMTLNYIWWNSSNHSQPPMLLDNQTWLYERGIENNSNPDLPYLDTRGLWYIIQYNKPMPYSTFGYNFMKYSSEDLDEALKRICLWINYTVGTVGGYKPGYPLHVPSVVPAYGNYSNWMAIRGFRSNRSAYPMPDEITIYGFWVNDPYPASLGRLGENSYKVLTQWLDDYYYPLNTDDIYNNKYVAILEPPEINENAVLTIAEPRPRFTPEQQDELKFIQLNKGLVSEDLIWRSNEWIIKAAIDGVKEELIPYDDHFATVFEKTVPGIPFYVKSLAGHDYYAVPFNMPIISNNFQRNLKKSVNLPETVVVILIDADNGHFKEASWVKIPVKYLPITKTDAQNMVLKVLEEMGIELEDISDMIIDLVHRKSTPYYPEWRITIEEYELELFISQDGKLSY